MRRFTTKLILVLAALSTTACSERDIFDNSTFTEAKVTEPTRATNLLHSIPAPAEKIAISVYNFDDQTGQFKANEKLTEYSSAVTKGGLAILYNALMDAGNRQWFTVVERGGFKNVMQERQIVRAMREQYLSADGRKLPDLPPLLYSRLLIEGGIIGYDTNTVTGGAAASYFGIGGNTEYRSNTVTVYLRAVDIQTGEVLISTTSSKTIYSMRLQGNIFKYLSTDRILQAETGFTVNEPVELAVRQAIETAVYSMVMEGANQKLWSFANQSAGTQAMREYVARKTGEDVPEPAPAPRPQPMPAQPMPVARPEPAPEAAPVMPVTQAPVPMAPSPPPAPAMAPPPPPVASTPQPAIEEPAYRNAAPVPILPPEQAPEARVREPMPKPEFNVAPPSQQPQATLPSVRRTPEPNALIKYLNDSRYTNRRNGNAPMANCQTDPSNPECKP